MPSANVVRSTAWRGGQSIERGKRGTGAVALGTPALGMTTGAEEDAAADASDESVSVTSRIREVLSLITSL